jgi:hypothetical protein
MMKQLVLVVALMGGLIGASRPASVPSTLPAESLAAVDALVKEFGPRLVRSRYMQRGEGKEIALPGWDGFPIRRYTYAVKDKDGAEKSADVVMLNPSPEQVARWIVSALVEVKGKYDPADGQKLFKHVIGQSGGQFPVAGVVYEDILPEDGKNEIYCFRDGVTVVIEGVPHRGTDPMTPAQVEASISGKVKRVYTYGRIASTSPQMWIDAGGSKDVLQADGKPNEKWLETVRKSYQDAWVKDRNELFVAWVKSNMK